LNKKTGKSVKKMPDFRVSQSELIALGRNALQLNYPRKMFFYEAPEGHWLHLVPRLLVMIEGSCIIKYQLKGRMIAEKIYAPAIFFCDRYGLLEIDYGDNCHLTNKTFSFSYFPAFIRSMLIDYDGKNLPPTPRDIYYHSVSPLSNGGNLLIDSMKTLYKEGNSDLAAELLMPLFELTLRDLGASDGASSLNMSALWVLINTFIREHHHENFSRNQVAKLFQISPGYVSELMKKYTGQTFSDLKLQYQLEYAENLLLKTRLSINEIADQVGFSCANYFIRRFRSVYNVTPHVFRNNQQKK